MVFQLIPNETCSNITLWHQDQLHITVDTILLSIILTYILCLNLAVVVVTIWSAELRGCLFSMQLAATYVGNILGGVSLIGNDMYFTRTGVLPICQAGVDHYSVLYFGISMNMVILLLNTRYRYVGISNIKRVPSMRNVQTSSIVLKVWIPTIIVSTIICTIATVVQVYVIEYQFIVSMGLCAPPLVCSILLNGLLSRRLKIGRQNSKIVNREESLQVLDRATFIVNATIIAHSAFLLLCTVAIVCSLFFYEEKGLLVAISWLLRLLYLLLFTIEGHVYLSKVKPARDLLKKKILHCLCLSSFGRNSSDYEEEEVKMEP